MKYCKYCKKHTLMKVSQSKKSGSRGALKHGSIVRAKKRGLGHGAGNKGRWGSRPAINKFKMTGKKQSKKTDLRYKCTVCNKSMVQSHGVRAKKVEFK